MRICELMSHASIHYTPEDPLKTVVKSMSQERHSCGIICKNNKPVGIITERDLVRYLDKESDFSKINSVTVSEVMTRDPICITSSTEVAEALELARSHALRHLPVVSESGEFSGVVTLTDLTKALATMHKRNAGLVNENSKLRVLAVEDPLTGLPNRRAMEVDLAHVAAVAMREDSNYAIAMIDIDYFKKYNDHYGHLAGDTALCHVAKVLHDGKREADKLYRYGGEEFLMLMPFTARSGAEIAVNRILESIKEANIEHSECPFKTVTVSVGIAQSSSKLTWEELIRRADDALYSAKEAGRNGYKIYPSSPLGENAEPFMNSIDGNSPGLN